jgi:hypothetical protein
MLKPGKFLQVDLKGDAPSEFWAENVYPLQILSFLLVVIIGNT